MGGIFPHYYYPPTDLNYGGALAAAAALRVVTVRLCSSNDPYHPTTSLTLLGSNDPPIQDDPTLEDYNVDERVASFLAVVAQTASVTLGGNGQTDIMLLEVREEGRHFHTRIRKRVLLSTTAPHPPPSPGYPPAPPPPPLFLSGH